MRPFGISRDPREVVGFLPPPLHGCSRLAAQGTADHSPGLRAARSDPTPSKRSLPSTRKALRCDCGLALSRSWRGHSLLRMERRNPRTDWRPALTAFQPIPSSDARFAASPSGEPAIALRYASPLGSILFAAGVRISELRRALLLLSTLPLWQRVTTSPLSAFASDLAGGWLSACGRIRRQLLSSSDSKRSASSIAGTASRWTRPS